MYVVSFDRPGYGQSDPDPKQTMQSIALDIEELADKLGLGSRFYLLGFSMGGQIGWSCLKYIPHRYPKSVELELHLILENQPLRCANFRANSDVAGYQVQHF